MKAVGCGYSPASGMRGSLSASSSRRCRRSPKRRWLCNDRRALRETTTKTLTRLPSSPVSVLLAGCWLANAYFGLLSAVSEADHLVALLPSLLLEKNTATQRPVYEALRKK